MADLENDMYTKLSSNLWKAYGIRLIRLCGSGKAYAIYKLLK